MNGDFLFVSITKLTNKCSYSGNAYHLYQEFLIPMASIAHVYNVNRIPFISIRCITDTDACRGMCNFEENCAKASRVAKNITVDLLNELRG